MIKLKDVDVASDMLGVFICPNGNATAQLKHMISKDMRWSLKVRESTLSTHEA
jgi:hypothetical protein